MFHSISKINNKNDANKALMQVIDYIPHLMFYFASTRDLVNHIACDVTYLKMKDIDDNGMPNILKTFANRFNYKYSNVMWGGDESVIKGSIFPRCFPHIFNIGKFKFVLSTLSRLNGMHIKEMDMSNDIGEVRESINKQIFIIDDNIIPNEEYKQYPLVLATLSNKVVPMDILENSKKIINKYIEFALENINKHKKICFDENSIIDYLITQKEFSKKLAMQIHNQLRYIREENPQLLQEFIYTQRFLKMFNIDMYSK